MSSDHIVIDPQKFLYNKDMGIYIQKEISTLNYDNGKSSDRLLKKDFPGDTDFVLPSKAFKLAENQGLFIPTSGQWGRERKRLQKMDEAAGISYDDDKSLESGYLTGLMELTGSVIDFSGKYPVLWENFHFDSKGKLKGGTRKTVQWLPRKNGYVQGFNEELGLVTKVGEQPNRDYSEAVYVFRKKGEPTGISPVLRGEFMFDKIEMINPWKSIDNLRYGLDVSFDLFKCLPINIVFRVASKTDDVLLKKILS